MTEQEILNLKFYCNDLNREVTIGEYFKELLQALWIEEESFSGKRPFGNSGWQSEVEQVLYEQANIEESNLTETVIKLIWDL